MAKKPLFCDDCGTRNTPDSKYCKECGAQIHVAYQTPALSVHDQVDDATQLERLTQFLDMAFWHNEAGNTDAAMRACEAALAINPNSTTAHSLLGSLYEKKGEDALAIEHFERVLALNPDSEADREKLEQVREGFHAKPVRPSPVYRWLPPIFATARFSGLAEKLSEWNRPGKTLLPAGPAPVLAAGAAAVLVLAGGLFLIKPGSQAAATPRPTATLRPVSPGRSAFGGASGTNALTAKGAPTTAWPTSPVTSPVTSFSPTTSAPAGVPWHNPFAGMSPPPREAEALSPVTSARRSARMTRGRGTGHGGIHPLPPLITVPPANDGPLLPAPVSVPASVQAAQSSSAANVPHHTYVVQRFNGTPPEFGQIGLRPAAADTGNGEQAAPAPPPPTPHIEITIDRSSDGSSNAGGSGDNAPAGETYQQTAFALQQQGDYRGARATYQKAIRAYQDQIAAGRDPEAARRGLEACKTGLQICQQNP